MRFIFHFIFVAIMWWMPVIAAAQLRVTVHPNAYIAEIDDPALAKQRVADTPGNASFFAEDAWSNQRAATVKDVTDYIPGVFAQARNGAESSRLSVRGSGLANAFQGRGLMVLQDGIPINTADGGFEFPAIEPWLIKYATVYPGANALETGGSSFGGAMDFITPTGVSSEGYTLRGEGGSFGTIHGLASYGRKWEGGDMFAAVTGFSQDGFREQNKQQTGRFNSNWGWQGNEHFSNRMYISHTSSDAEIPGAITLAQLKNDPRAANPANVAGDYQRNVDITRIANKSAWEEGADRVDAAIFYTYRTLDNPVTTYEFQNDRDIGIRAKYTHRYDKSHWLAGFNTYFGTADEARYRNVAGVTGPLILIRNLYALTQEAYGQVEQQLANNLYGIAGIQGAYTTRDIHERFPTSRSQYKDYTGFSPRVGLRYDLDERKQVFANISRSFEPPTWGELSGGNAPGFNSLKAQRATTAEIGARGVFDSVHWQAAYFHGWLRNEFVNYRFADGSSDTINAARSKRDGVELAANGDVLCGLWREHDAVNFRAAYTLSYYTLDNDPLYGNNTLPGVPKHYLRAEILYRHPSRFSIGPNIEYSPARAPVDLTNSLYAGAYTVFGARALWESEDKNINFYVEGRNLLDRNYIATYNVIPDAAGRDGRYFYPGEGRAVYAGFTWKL